MATRDVACRVLGVECHPLPYYTISLETPPDFPEVAPGQFVMALADPGRDPYLRRAFSVFDVSRAEGLPRLELLGKVIGRGTSRLAARRVGDTVRVLGPLGRGFRIEGAGRAALVAGGVGSAALLLLARALHAAGSVFDVLYGGRRADDLACADRFADLVRRAGGELVAVTEDGSRGRRGLVTEALEDGLAASRWHSVFTCGPTPMMARVAALATHHGVPGQAALETPMGCGYGACLGCAVPHRDGRFALCCQDGPVFDFDEVSW
jgi:dihydroorotate dehydrogenase electron transfer subunit